MSVLGVRPPALVALLGIDGCKPLACLVAPDGVPLDQEGTCQTLLDPTWVVQQALELGVESGAGAVADRSGAVHA